MVLVYILRCKPYIQETGIAFPSKKETSIAPWTGFIREFLVRGLVTSKKLFDVRETKQQRRYHRIKSIHRKSLLMLGH